MKKLIPITLFALCLAAVLPAQTLLTNTTLSAALTASQTVMTVGSATGFTANSTVAYVDHELVDVRAVSGTTITIRRGAGGTAAVAHKSGQIVFVGAPSSFIARKVEADLSGTCTRGTAPADILPKINVLTGTISDCLGGTWVNGLNDNYTKFRLSSPEPGATAYTSINTNGTAPSATKVHCTEVFLPFNKQLTGIGLLNGTTVGTDNHYVILYDAAGNALANSAVAGVLSANASTYQNFSFTSTYFAVGPAQYFACFQSNGTTDTVRMVVTGTQDNILTKGQTGATFGTIPALTVPTTFTTAVGPYVQLF